MTINACNNDQQGMACLKENLMSSLSADSENVNYPAENVLDDHPKKVWKTTSTGSGTLTFDVGPGASTLAIFGTNAERLRVTVSDPNAIEWESGVSWEDGVEWSNVPLVSGDLFELTQSGDTRALWVDFISMDSSVVFTLEFTTSKPENISVGVVMCGPRVDVGVNPLKGMTESLTDFSIERELSNGARYAKRRDIVRNFSGRLFVERERQFYDFLYDIAREIGPFPAAWKIADINLQDWIVFGRLNGMPSGTHDYFRYSYINFNIQEVL